MKKGRRGGDVVGGVTNYKQEGHYKPRGVAGIGPHARPSLALGTHTGKMSPYSLWL